MAPRNIPLFKVNMPEDIHLALQPVLESGFVTEGPRSKEFETKLQEWLGNPFTAVVNSGTMALTLAYRMAGVGPGTETIVSPLTCLASTEPIQSLGGTVRWCDIDPSTGNIDPGGIEGLITSRTVAVSFTDWAGTPCELDAINSIAHRYGLKTIEDAAHSLGACYRGQKVGNICDYTCFGAGTWVLTRSGKRRIKDIKVGEEVLTRDGTYQRVIDTLERSYSGEWTRIYGGQARLVCTKEHPIFIHRDGRDQWLQAYEIRVGDCFYVATKECSSCLKELVPIYGEVCSNCYTKVQYSRSKREKLSKFKTRKPRGTSRLIHHSRWVQPIMDEYESKGYRVIPLIKAIPDFLAIADQKVIAVEVESGTTVKLNKENKYQSLLPYSYDDVIWHTREKKRNVATRYSYTLVGNLARVRVRRVETSYRANSQGKPGTRKVYNLTVDGNHTYFAHGILVHNCLSFQAIKHLTTVDGGALACSSKEDYDRAVLLRWFGCARGHNSSPVKWTGDVVEYGYKGHMNDVNATIGLESLKTIDDVIAAHKRNGAYLRDALQGIPGVELLEISEHIDSSFWIFTLKLRDSNHRAEVSQRLTEAGIGNGIVHTRNDQYSLFRSDSTGSLPGLDDFSDRMLNVPCGWWCAEEDLDHIVKVLDEG